MKWKTGSLVLGLVLVVFGCAPRPVARPGDSAPASHGPSQHNAPPPLTKTLAKPETRVFDESLLRGKEFLLETGTGPEARDVSIGVPYRGPEAQAVTRFLTNLGDPSPLDPGWADYLRSWARAASEEGLAGEVRVGAPVSGSEVLVPVRVVGPEKEWRGWVVLVNREGHWMVNDLQLSSQDRERLVDPEAVQPISSPSRR